MFDSLPPNQNPPKFISYSHVHVHWSCTELYIYCGPHDPKYKFMRSTRVHVYCAIILGGRCMHHSAQKSLSKWIQSVIPLLCSGIDPAVHQESLFHERVPGSRGWHYWWPLHSWCHCWWDACIQMYYILYALLTLYMCMYMQKFMCVYSLNTPSSHPKMQYYTRSLHTLSLPPPPSLPPFLSLPPSLILLSPSLPLLSSQVWSSLPLTIWYEIRPTCFSPIQSRPSLRTCPCWMHCSRRYTSYAHYNIYALQQGILIILC